MMNSMSGETISNRATVGRVLSLDVLRGLTIALMILVNDPGDWAHTYTQLDHAAWNGFTLTDFVFPNFLFLVGAAIILSLGSRQSRGDSKSTLALNIVRRAGIIFAIKMFLTAFPYFHYTHFRIYGVLTRIALCYLVVGLLCLVTQRARVLLLTAAGLLVGYWILMRFVPVPGFGVPTQAIPMLDPDRNLAAWIDRGVNAWMQRTLHTGTLYEHTRDPEGLLSTIPAVATTILGACAALWLRRPEGDALRKGLRLSTLGGLVLFAILGIASGLVWNYSFPINKNLWTSSYVLFAAGLSFAGLALCYWLIDLRRLNESAAGKRLLWPWLVFGSNAIAAFVISNFVVKLMLWIKVPDSFSATRKPIAAWGWTYWHVFARHGSNNITSLAFALAFVGVCFIPNWLLWRKRIFLKA
jgi:predicted acyltransferase